MEGCSRMFTLLELWVQWAFESSLPLYLHFGDFSGPVAVREMCAWVLSLYIQSLFKKMVVALHKQCRSRKDSPPLCGCQGWMLWELFSFFFSLLLLLLPCTPKQCVSSQPPCCSADAASCT